MSYKIIDVYPDQKKCCIEYNGKRITFFYDYYIGRISGEDEDNEYIFPDRPGNGGWLGKALFEYKTFREQVTSEEFKKAVMTEMVKKKKKKNPLI